MEYELTKLEDLLERLDRRTGDSDRISIGMIVDAVGEGAFGPMLVVVGLILVSPLSGVPGAPTTMGAVVMLIAIQLLLRRKRLWLPQSLLRRTLSQKKLSKSIGWIRRPASFIDNRLQPRMTVLTRGFGLFPIPIFCILIALSLPVMEFVPFSATSAGLVLTAFGLSLVAQDGLLALMAFLLTGLTYIFILSRLLQ